MTSIARISFAAEKNLVRILELITDLDSGIREGRVNDVRNPTELGNDALSETSRQTANRFARHPVHHFSVEFLTAITGEHADLSLVDVEVLEDFERSLGISDEIETQDIGSRLKFLQATAQILLTEALSEDAI